MICNKTILRRHGWFMCAALSISGALLPSIALAECVQLADTNFECQGPSCPSANYQPDGKTSSRVALVFGNNAYNGKNRIITPLKNAETDAKDLARTLEAQGFTVRCILNANRDQAGTEVGALAKHARLLHRASSNGTLPMKDIRVLLYFAGHGFRRKDANYVVFSETFKSEFDPEEILAASRQVNDLLADLKDFARVHPFLVIDACRTAIPLDLQPGARGVGHEANDGDTLPDFPGYYVVYSTSDGRAAADEGPRFMDHFKGEIDAWGRDFSGIFTQTQTLLKATQRATAFGNTELAAQRWRSSGDSVCDRALHSLAADLIHTCGGNRPSAACFKEVEPSDLGCNMWNFINFQQTVTPSCRRLLASPAFQNYGRACQVAVAAADLEIGRTQIALTGLNTGEARGALAKGRYDAFVTKVVAAADISDVGGVRGTRASGGFRAVASPRPDWNDLLLTAKPGTKGTEIAASQPSATPNERTVAVKTASILEPVCDAYDCGGGRIAVNVYERGQSPRYVGGTRTADATVRRLSIDRAAVAPRMADDVLILRSVDPDAALGDAEARDLDRLVRKYADQAGSRIRVTGGYLRPLSDSAEAEVEFETDIVKAIARSQRVGERVIRIAAPLGFKPPTQLRAGETVLVDLSDRATTPVFVEFYKGE